MRDIEEMRKQLGFTNDFIFCTVMEENPDLCKRLVEGILGRKIDRIEVINQQRTIRNYISNKNVCLDVYFEDDKNTVYNIEMQTTSDNDIKRRARYYQGKIDCKNTYKGSFYRDMKDSYIIFICTFDPLDMGLPIYTAKTYIAEDKDIEYDDGATKIFINASKQCRPELLEQTSLDLRALISYCSRKEVSNKLTHDIEDKVIEALEDDEKVVQAMTVGEELEIRYYNGVLRGREEGLEEGMNRKSVEDINAIVSKFNVSLEEACETVGISLEDYNRIKSEKRTNF